MKINADRRSVRAAAGRIAVHLRGDAGAPAVMMAHSILTSSVMWERQAALLSEQGLFVICMDTRGHGASEAPAGPYSMNDLAADAVAVLDALNIERTHYVGVSLGAMSGLGLGIHHASRLLSLCLCSVRADAPPEVAAPWDQRIATVIENRSCAPLAIATIERWFGASFAQRQPALYERFVRDASATAVEGFVGCARAIQLLDYASLVAQIRLPTTLIAGANDGMFPTAMRQLQGMIAGSHLDVIAGAGHLPNTDQPCAFNDALCRHFQRCMAAR